MSFIKIGLIGAGAIGSFLLEKINGQNHEKMKVTSIFVRNPEKYQPTATKYNVKLYTNIDEFLNDPNTDIVVEAANVALTERLLPIVIKKKDMMVISVGALVNETLLREVVRLAETHDHVVHLPSGAVGGLDLLQNAHALGAVQRISLTTRKPAHSLIDEKITEEKVVFQGRAIDAIKDFPKNMNVSIVLSLAALGVKNTEVQLIADPNAEKNIHHVEIEGEFGAAEVTITNNPLPANPKTSYLAALSVLGTLERLNQSIRIG